jgi:uncharacterized oxidoreductase
VTTGGDTVCLDPPRARSAVARLLRRVGASTEAAGIVADHLVDASLRGVHSHGLIRVPQYLDEASTDAFDPTAMPSVAHRVGGLVTLDGHRAFGQVGGVRAAQLAVDVAHDLGCSIVTVGRVAHTGRIGAYAEAIAERGMLGIVFASGTGMEGRRVAPFGGVEGRYITDPIAYAFFAGSTLISADFATSATAEGVVRSLRNRGLPAPEWMLFDPDGSPTTDPMVLYRTPPGTIQPLGGPAQGHKGSALNLMVEALATLLAGREFDEAASPHNTLAVLAIRVDGEFRGRAGRLVDYVSSTRPANPRRPVLLPGAPERQARAAARSVELDRPSWDAIRVWAGRLGVRLPTPLS